MKNEEEEEESFPLGKGNKHGRNVEKDFWEMASALLPPQGFCAQSSQVYIDIPTVYIVRDQTSFSSV